MNKNYFLFLICCLCSQWVWAQADSTKPDPYWKIKFSAGVNVNQASFSDNWKAGGVNSLAIGSFLNFNANYTKDKISFVNDLQLQYGVIQNSGQDLQKNIDRIFFDTKLGYALAKSWSAFASVNFQSQFDVGFVKKQDALGNDVNVRISDFLAPGYLSEALGIQYQPVPYFSILFGVGAMRQTVVKSDVIQYAEPTNYGVVAPSYLRNEAAFQLVINFDKDIAKNINLKFRYMGFANYENINKPETIDHRINLSLTAKVNRFVNVSISGVGLYDIDQDLSFQYSQALALGVLYNFQNFIEKK